MDSFFTNTNNRSLKPDAFPLSLVKISNALTSGGRGIDAACLTSTFTTLLGPVALDLVCLHSLIHDSLASDLLFKDLLDVYNARNSPAAAVHGWPMRCVLRSAAELTSVLLDAIKRRAHAVSRPTTHQLMTRFTDDQTDSGVDWNHRLGVAIRQDIQQQEACAPCGLWQFRQQLHQKIHTMSDQEIAVIREHFPLLTRAEAAI